MLCVGAARGLDYLHHDTSTKHKIIHRDIKPDNILLDVNLEPKISDFGLSRRGFENHVQSEAFRTTFAGTYGYYAPDYVCTHKATRKTDVYSFGVVLFEVLCRGKRPWPSHDHSTDDLEEEEEVVVDMDIGLWARQHIANDLKHQISPSCLEAFINIASRCLLETAEERPNMTDVVSAL